MIQKIQWNKLSPWARMEVERCSTLEGLFKVVAEHVIGDLETVGEEERAQRFKNIATRVFDWEDDGTTSIEVTDDGAKYTFRNSWSIPLFWYIRSRNRFPNFHGASQEGLTLDLYYKRKDEIVGPYSSYLMAKKIYRESGFWKKRSKAIREKDGKCAICGFYEDSKYGLSLLHAHHWSYYRMGTDYELEQIQTLCFACHSAVHKICGPTVKGIVRPSFSLIHTFPAVLAFLQSKFEDKKIENRQMPGREASDNVGRDCN